jgi:hypothetical protein
MSVHWQPLSGLVETGPHPVRQRPGNSRAGGFPTPSCQFVLELGWRVGVVAARGMVDWSEACEGASGSAGRTEFTSRFVVEGVTIS